jgi:hypothetical protein
MDIIAASQSLILAAPLAMIYKRSCIAPALLLRGLLKLELSWKFLCGLGAVRRGCFADSDDDSVSTMWKDCT